jgi:uncharacterized protein YbjT (DUF2867 family)
MAKILLAGATGMVGAVALDLLLGDDRVSRVVAPTRRPLSQHPKLLNPTIDSTDIKQDAEWWMADGAICALGTTRAKAGSAAAYRAIDYDYTLAVATQLRASGAARFALVTSTGADPKSWFLYTRTKGELEAAVDRLGFGSLTIVRPGFLGGRRNEHRPMERALGAVLSRVAPILPVGARISPAASVAAFLVEAALTGRPGKHIVSSAQIARSAEGLT